MLATLLRRGLPLRDYKLFLLAYRTVVTGLYAALAVPILETGSSLRYIVSSSKRAFATIEFTVLRANPLLFIGSLALRAVLFSVMP